MGDAAKLRELLERVEKASGPDTELDAAILIAFDPEGEPAKIMSGFFKDVKWELAYGGLSYRTESGGGSMPMPRYTASLDASIALVERMLPGWAYKLIREGDRFVCVVNSTGSLAKIGPSAVGSSATMALASLKALLLALIAQGEGEDA